MFGLFMQQLRLKRVRRLPIAFGWLTKRGDAATAGRRGPPGHRTPRPGPRRRHRPAAQATASVGALLVLHAFAAGRTALTG
jgi:hypothetical protein